MELDFTGLNNIALEAARSDFKDTDEDLYNQTTETATEPATELQRDIMRGAALAKPDRDKKDHARMLEVYREYQKNTKLSGKLQRDIIQGVRAGEPVQGLFLKACKAISLMTSNSLFYSQIEGDLMTIYGKGQGDCYYLERELNEVQGRLERMREACKRESDTDSLKRIEQAIKEHEKRETELLELLEAEKVAV